MKNEQRKKYTKVQKLEHGSGWRRSGLASRFLAATGFREFLNLCESQLQIQNDNAKLSYFTVLLQNSKSTGSNACESIFKTKREGGICVVFRETAGVWGCFYWVSVGPKQCDVGKTHKAPETKQPFQKQ